MRKIGPFVVLGLLALAILSSFPIIRRSGSTCVVCRLWRRDVSLGLTWTAYQETECSRYYAEHVEPVHQHVWGRTSCATLVNVFGRPVGVACGDRHPILSLDSEDQMAIYRHFEDPAEARRMFLETGGEGPRDWERGRLIVSAIADWYVAGLPGEWESWRDRCLAQHPGGDDEALHGPPDLRRADPDRPPVR
ncbi:hypothetical protein [Paludisphaera soli]|uniref:hypothetical protein n=1 Tax=Paludisphaera soli TaxID=2712865 RepID=UPI0013EE182F|nr:hypothetical protein [Paludisphaera soli]